MKTGHCHENYRRIKEGRSKGRTLKKKKSWTLLSAGKKNKGDQKGDEKVKRRGTVQWQKRGNGSGGENGGVTFKRSNQQKKKKVKALGGKNGFNLVKRRNVKK